MFVFKEGGLTTLDQLSTSMVPGSGAVSTHGWSLVEAGSLVPREGQSPDHLNMNGLHSKSRPHGMATQVMGEGVGRGSTASVCVLTCYRRAS